MKKIHVPAFLALFILLVPSADGIGQVVLEKAVVGSAAGRASNGTTVAELTVGQPVTGYATDGRINGAFGFWHDAFVVASIGGEPGAGAITALQVAPNPTTDRATVTLSLARAGQLDITLHDATGRQVAQIYSGERGVGDLILPIEPGALPAGTYHIAVQSHGALLQGSITIIR